MSFVRSNFTSSVRWKEGAALSAIKRFALRSGSNFLAQLDRVVLEPGCASGRVWQEHRSQAADLHFASWQPRVLTRTLEKVDTAPSAIRIGTREAEALPGKKASTR